MTAVALPQSSSTFLSSAVFRLYFSTGLLSEDLIRFHCPESEDPASAYFMADEIIADSSEVLGGGAAEERGTRERAGEAILVIVQVVNLAKVC